MAKAGGARVWWRYVTAGIGFISCLLFSSPAAATAPPEPVKWSRVNIPGEGNGGSWALAPGSDISGLAMAPDGAIYASVQGLDYNLYRSTDGGYAWSNLDIQEDIIAIAFVPENPGYVYCATSSTVYRSTDGGRSFTELPPNPGGAGTGNIEITALDAARLDGNTIAVSTRDFDAGQFGGIYALNEKDAIPAWADLGVGPRDVYALAFSPSYQSDRQLIAVVSDESDTLVTTKYGAAGWGDSSGDALLKTDSGASIVPVSAAIAFPPGYDSEPGSTGCSVFVAVDTGSNGGDVYRIEGRPGGSTATDLNTGDAYGLRDIDIYSLAAGGEAAHPSLLAGAAGSALIYFSRDGGRTWTRSRKSPTGSSKTSVLMAHDTQTLYSATSGSGSAFSVSRDNGATWNQTGLIDTSIGSILDFAPSPVYASDNTMFLLTFGDKPGLWRSLDSGGRWERVFSGHLPNVDTIDSVKVSPAYGQPGRLVYLAGTSAGAPAFWRSADGGQSFSCRSAVDSSAVALNIDAWVVVGDDELWLASFDGSASKLYHSTSGGFIFSQRAAAGSQPLTCLVPGPDFARDGSLFAGTNNGWVYRLHEGLFEPLPVYALTPPLPGAVNLALDPGFAENGIVYATVPVTDKGVYRLVIGSGGTWENIDTTIPAGSLLGGLAASPQGLLYAANSKAGAGIERCLKPASADPVFASVNRGLTSEATLYGLWASGNQIWSLDSTGNQLLTFRDTLNSPATPLSPDDKAAGLGTLSDHKMMNIKLDWSPLEGATSYEWQLSTDPELSAVPAGLEGSTRGSSQVLPALEPATTYHWRVRASLPAFSPWSASFSFTTAMDTVSSSLKLNSPGAGATAVGARPVFQWEAISGAEAYELLVDTSPTFAEPVISRLDKDAIPGTAWRPDSSLEYGATYYWKVRAVSRSTVSEWSAVSAFVTEPAPLPAAKDIKTPNPAPSPPLNPAATPLVIPLDHAATLLPAPQSAPTTMPAQPDTPSPQPTPTPNQVFTPAWMLYFVSALLIIIILLLVIVLVLVIKAG